MRQVPSFTHMPLYFNIKREFGKKYEIREAWNTTLINTDTHRHTQTPSFPTQDYKAQSIKSKVLNWPGKRSWNGLVDEGPLMFINSHKRSETKMHWWSLGRVSAQLNVCGARSRQSSGWHLGQEHPDTLSKDRCVLCGTDSLREAYAATGVSKVNGQPTAVSQNIL